MSEFIFFVFLSLPTYVFPRMEPKTFSVPTRLISNIVSSEMLTEYFCFALMLAPAKINFCRRAFQKPVLSHFNILIHASHTCTKVYSSDDRWGHFSFFMYSFSFKYFTVNVTLCTLLAVYPFFTSSIID